MKKSVKLTALFCAAALLASSMLSPMSAVVQAKAKKPVLSKKKITITLGKTAKLKVKRAKGCKITWKSKKKKVVTVKKSGKYTVKLKAKKKGTAKVIATVKKGRKKYKLTCKVKVVLAKDDTSGITSNNPNVSTDASVTPTMPTQGKTDIPSSAPSVSPSGSPSDVPTAIPTETSGVPASTTPTETGNVTTTPTATATPAQQPTPTSGSTPVPTSVVTLKPDNYSMTLSADTFLGSGAVEGNPVYNADGSVTVTLTNQYGGGGIAFYFNELKSKVDVSDYTKVIFNLSADEQAPICISAYRSTDYWDDSDAGKAIALSYPTVTTEKKDFNCELTKCNEVLGFGVKYNTYGKEPDEIPEKFNLTIHSITFIRSSGGSVVTPTATPTEVSTPTPKTGDLVITKTVQGPVAAEEAVEAISFEVVNSVTGEIKELKLKDFAYSESDKLYTYTLKNLDAGKYTVKETIKDVAGFVLASVEYSVDGAAAIAGKEISVNVLPKTETIVAYENTYEPEMGNLILTKTLRGPILKEDAEKSISFEITNTETGDKIIKSLEDFSYSEEDQKYVLYIRDVVGTYKVKEIVADVDGLELVRAEYTVNSSDATEGENASASIEKDQSTVIGYVNEYGSTATANPTATGNVTATPTATGDVTATPSQKPTATPTQKPTATPSQKPTATPTQKPTATATVKPTETATAKPTDTATAKPTATVTPTAGIQPNDNAVLGSKVKWTGDTVAAKVDETGAVVEFEESPQYRQADFLMASSVSLENIDSVEFTLSVQGEPDTVSFKLYDSDGNELKNMTQYNKASGTYTVKIKDEYKGKTITQYSIMTDTSIEGTTQTATAVLSKLSFISATGEPVVIPTATPTSVSTPTPVPVVTPAPEQDAMTFSADTFLGSGAMEGSPVYNEDGSVTLTFTNQSGGGGVAFYFDESKMKVDLSNYTKAVFTLSADAGAPICINAYRSTNYWDGTEDGKAIALSYTDVTTEKKDYICELTNMNGVLGFGVKYNTYGKDLASIPEKLTLTIHSITFEKDMRDINDAIDNYTSLAKLAAEYGLMMGTVMNDRKVKDQKYGDLMKYHFNSITAANEMKAYSMLNESASKEAAKSDANAMPVLNFTSADAIMDFAKANGLKVRGHALVWDAGMKDWFFREGYDTSKSYASAEVVKARLKNYIEQVLAHFEEKYPGIIYCWDVVNEAVGDSSSEYAKGDDRHVRTMRGGASNPFYDIIGSDYVELSFQYTYEALQELKKTYEDLDIKLYYNDYNTFYADKRDAICALVNSINKFKSDGNGGYVKLCDGVGMQSYIGGFGHQNGCMDGGDIDKVKTAINKFAAQGVEVQVTELAVRNYQNDEATIAKHGDFYKKLFQAYLDVNSGEEKPLKAISIWGIVDIPDLPEEDYSFTMNGPFCGLFDETLAVKPAFINIHDLMKNGLENDQ